MFSFYGFRQSDGGLGGCGLDFGGRASFSQRRGGFDG